jgi:hypothetical protein
MGKLYDDLLLKLQRLRGPGKDIVGALTPIFAAMDTAKTGAVDASEFKTCLLALGLKATVSDVAALFTSFDSLHVRSGHKVAYVGFLRSLVDELPPIPGQPPHTGPFVSALVKPPPPPKPVAVAAYFPQASFRSTAPGGPKLSDEVRGFYGCEYRVYAAGRERERVGEGEATNPNVFIQVRVFNHSHPTLSPSQVGDFEEDVHELERTLRDVCAELAKTNAGGRAQRVGGGGRERGSLV